MYVLRRTTGQCSIAFIALFMCDIYYSIVTIISALWKFELMFITFIFTFGISRYQR